MSDSVKPRKQSDRRAAVDRRAGGDRRRNAETRQAVIHVTPTVLRALVLVERSGDQADVCLLRTLPWRIDAESLHSGQGSAELSAALATLANEERLSGAKAEVLLSSELCVTRAVTGVSDEVQRESLELRERSQLYLSLGPGRKVVAVESTPLDARHAHALLTVATEKTLQVVYQAVEAAGMMLTGIRSAQVSLARAVEFGRIGDEKASLVVGVEGGNVELGVMGGGRLFLDYRPGGGTKPEQLGELFGQHLSRLQRYCHRHHGLEGSTLRQVIISGSPEEVLLAKKSLSKLTQLDVHSLDLTSLDYPWEQRGDDLTPEMASVVGAALALTSDNSDIGPNLVDQVVAKARPPVMKMLARKCAPMAAMLVAAAVFAALSWHVRRDVTAMEAELALLAPRAARAAQLRLELMAGHAELAELGKLGSHIRQTPHSLFLRNLTQSTPSEVWLTGLRLDGDTGATLAGASYSESSIYDLVGHLQNLPGVGQAALQGTGVGRMAHRTATTFDIRLELDLSGKVEDKKETL